MHSHFCGVFTSSIEGNHEFARTCNA
jgi:hypothetical protein